MPVTRASHLRFNLLASSLAGAAAVFLTSAAHAQNLVTNSSFELGNFTGSNPVGASNTTQLLVGATNMTGWTVIGGGDISWEQNGNPYNLTASDGVRSLDLTGYKDSSPYGGVSQTLSLTAGSTYRLTFDLGSNSGYSGVVGIRAVVGNVDQTFTFTPNSSGAVQQYGTYTTTFFTNTASTALQLTGAASGGAGDYIGLDNVSVTVVSGAAAPEPGSIALLALSGLPIVGTIARRRRKTA